MKQDIESAKIGRRELRTGSVVRFESGKKFGPKWSGGGVSGIYTLPGWFVVRDIFRTRRFRDCGQWRTFIEVFGVDKTSGHFTVYVDGPTYTRNGVIWRPYRVHIKPEKTRSNL